MPNWCSAPWPRPPEPARLGGMTSATGLAGVPTNEIPMIIPLLDGLDRTRLS